MGRLGSLISGLRFVRELYQTQCSSLDTKSTFPPYASGGKSLCSKVKSAIISFPVSELLDSVDMAQFIGRPVGEQVKAFLEEFLGGYDNKYGLGSMSCAIYDTAIVSLVYKQSGVKPGWVFPSCFEYLLKTQEESGGWQSGASEIDGILNTLAGLLAISKHSKDSTAPPDIAYRLEKATQYLNNSLEKWNVGATVHVAFEILVPMLLEVLAKTEDIHFDFPGKSPLFKIRDKKLSKFDPSFLYSKHSSSILHSLEGLVGRVDYDRVAPLKIFGSMMASPSATAAYIMHASTWDEEAEDYLRHVVSAGAGKGSGGVPSAFPSTIFEITWVRTERLVASCTHN